MDLIMCAAEEACGLPRECAEYCMKHYMRFKRTGTTLPSIRRLTDPRAANKWCRACHLDKPKADFTSDPGNRDGLGSYCRVCEKAQKRRRHLWTKYKITPEQWDFLRDTQGGGCAICGFSRQLVVDHDHATGVVRGLLCQACNKMLGCAFDEAGRLKAAAAYLEAI